MEAHDRLRGALLEADDLSATGDVETMVLSVTHLRSQSVHLYDLWHGTLCGQHVDPTNRKSFTPSSLLEEDLCAECFSGEAVLAKDASGAHATNHLLLLLALSKHREDRTDLEAAVESGSMTLGQVTAVDQDAQWIVAGAGHAWREAEGSWKSHLERMMSEARKTFSLTRRSAATKEIRAEIEAVLPGPKKRRSKGKRRVVIPTEIETRTLLLGWRGTRRDLRLELNPRDLHLILSWLVHEDSEWTFVKVTGKPATHLTTRTGTRPRITVEVDPDVTDAELETALVLWKDRGSTGPSSVLEATIRAARTLHA